MIISSDFITRIADEEKQIQLLEEFSVFSIVFHPQSFLNPIIIMQGGKDRDKNLFNNDNPL